MGSGHFRDILFKTQRDKKYDGIHLMKSAEYQFTYRLIKAPKTKLFVRNRRNTGRHFKHSNPQTENMGQSANSGQGEGSERVFSDVLTRKRQLQYTV